MQKRLFIETYGCQINVADSEVVTAVLRERDYVLTSSDADGDAILINTCLYANYLDWGAGCNPKYWLKKIIRFIT